MRRSNCSRCVNRKDCFVLIIEYSHLRRIVGHWWRSYLVNYKVSLKFSRLSHSDHRSVATTLFLRLLESQNFFLGFPWFDYRMSSNRIRLLLVCLPAYFQSNQLSKANHKRAHSENELRSEATKGALFVSTILKQHLLQSSPLMKSN